MSTLLIKNIGEFFTGDIAAPQAAVTSLLIDGAKIAALDPPADTKADAVLDAGGSAVMPGLVDGHVHPVFGEWTPTQDTIGWIGNYVHGGTTTMVSACELHVPGLDYENLTPDLVTSLAVVTAATTGRIRWSGARVHAGTVILVPGMTEDAFRPARRGEVDPGEVHLLPARGTPGRGAAIHAMVPRPRHPHQGAHRRRVALGPVADVRLRHP